MQGCRADRSATFSWGDDRSGELDVLVVFWDLLEPPPHDPDVQGVASDVGGLERTAGSNRTRPDFTIASPLMSRRYEVPVPGYFSRREKAVVGGRETLQVLAWSAQVAA